MTIAPKASATQTFTVKVRDKAVPGTYYNSLELYCGVNGDFVSGPLAPVTCADLLCAPWTGDRERGGGPARAL